MRSKQKFGVVSNIKWDGVSLVNLYPVHQRVFRVTPVFWQLQVMAVLLLAEDVHRHIQQVFHLQVVTDV